jgi:hypothetical protein
MKNIFFALVIVLAALGACNPPQKTTDTTSDSTGVNNNTRDTSMRSQSDTSGSTQRDTSMHK